jgi:2-keto-4-pentenoate hydratase/2-oxohepta-3-ene-1,7-dioic acid hydratase in catechol pathway
MEYGLANLITADGERAAIWVPSGFFRLDQLVSARYAGNLRSLMDDWVEFQTLLPRLVDECDKQGGLSLAYVPIADAMLSTPIKYPNKVVCVGGVYKDHLLEFNLPAQRWPKLPMFLRPPSTSLIGPGGQVQVPPRTQQFDWEVELVVVMGRRLTDGDLKTAREAIAGYSIGLDLTCRDLLDRESTVGVDLVRAKAQDGMAPVGPMLVPADVVGDPQSLRLRLYVNDEIKQDGSTVDMMYTVYEQIAIVSQYITLEPGDIVFTGSPAGSGASIGQFLKPGDRVRAEIERIGRLEIDIAATRKILDVESSFHFV